MGEETHLGVGGHPGDFTSGGTPPNGPSLSFPGCFGPEGSQHPPSSPLPCRWRCPVGEGGSAGLPMSAPSPASALLAPFTPRYFYFSLVPVMQIKGRRGG